MRTLRGKKDVMAELEEIEREGKEGQCTGMKFRATQLFTTSELRKATLLAIILQVAQQWSGINAVSIQYSSISKFSERGCFKRRRPF